MQLIVIRHGETEWNLEGRKMGHLDSPLTNRGIAQAKAIANRLANVPFHALYSSDLGRAMQTARFIATTCNKTIIPHRGLRERNGGIFQGLTEAEIHKQYLEEKEKQGKLCVQLIINNSESNKQISERSIKMMTEIANRHSNQTIVIVTHGGFLRAFFEFVLGITSEQGWRFKRMHASYNQ